MRRYLVLLTMTFAILCTGCESVQSELTTEENNMIAEYIAGALLKHDLRYEKKLIYKTEDVEKKEMQTEPKEPKETIPPTTTPAPTSEDKLPIEEAAQKYEPISEIYNIRDFDIQYKNAKECQSYPKTSTNSYFLLEANPSNKLLVLNFNIQNTNKSEKNFCMINAGVNYQLQDNTGKSYKPLLTALTNDLQYLDRKIAGKKSEKAVLVFEIPQENKIENYTLYITKNKAVAEEKIG
ncbi:MAG: hypothetical protein RSJ40_10105 [Acetivibrio sp.]